MIPGIGTLVNVATVLLGAAWECWPGIRLPERTRDVVTDALGLVTLLIAATSAVAVGATPRSPSYVGSSAPMLIVLGSLVIGGIVGSLLRLEARVESLGGWLQTRLAGDRGSVERHRFIEGFVVSSLVFCMGPLTILGSLNDGLGRAPTSCSSSPRSTGSPRSRSRRPSAGGWRPARSRCSWSRAA